MGFGKCTLFIDQHPMDVPDNDYIHGSYYQSFMRLEQSCVYEEKSVTFTNNDTQIPTVDKKLTVRVILPPKAVTSEVNILENVHRVKLQTPWWTKTFDVATVNYYAPALVLELGDVAHVDESNYENDYLKYVDWS